MPRSPVTLTQFLEALPDAALVFDRGSTVTHANALAHRLFGYPPGGLAAKPLERLIGSSEPDQVTSARCRNGTAFSAVVRLAPLEPNGEQRILCLIRPATDQGPEHSPAWHSMERHRRALDHMLEGCQIIGFDWRYLYVNDAVCRHGKKRREDLLGRTMREVYPGIEHTAVFAAIGRCMEQRSPLHLENEFTYPDGTSGWFELSIQPVPEGVLVLSIEITDRKRAEAEIESKLRHLNALREIDLAIIGSTDVNVALKTVLGEVTTQLGVDAAAVLLYNPHSQALEYAVGRGFRTRDIEQTRLRLGEGLAGRAALEQRPVSGPPPEEPRECARLTQLVAREGFVFYQAIPLVAKAKVKGILELFHRAPPDPSPDWIAFRDALAGQAAIAIDSGTLFSDLQRANLNLLLAYDTTIEGWSRALDLRDRETVGHTLRVTEMTLRLARQAGMSEAELVHVRRGALLHDIGKMGVPDAILHKPSALTKDEWDVMRKHPVFAFELLLPIEYLRPALDIPYCHHERWDGSGYPRGLRGDQIPFAARLFAVVDIWDALRSDRPYRTGWPDSKVQDHLRSISGTLLDPRAVELFFAVLEDPSTGSPDP